MVIIRSSNFHSMQSESAAEISYLAGNYCLLHLNDYTCGVGHYATLLHISPMHVSVNLGRERIEAEEMK